MTTYLDATAVKVDGVDLASSGAELTWEGSLFDAIEATYDTISYPGSDASDTTDGYVQPTVWTARLRVTGTDLDDTWAKIRALRRRTKPGRRVDLTRSMPGGEADAIVALTAQARRLGDTLAWNEVNENRAVLAVDFTLLGPWYPATATAIASAAGTQTIAGDLRTHRILASLSSGAASPKVTNTTNGYYFRFDGAVPSGGVLVDVLERSARRLSNGADVSDQLHWGKPLPFQLDPGANVITVSAGTCAISYYPAYQ